MHRLTELIASGGELLEAVADDDALTSLTLQSLRMPFTPSADTLGPLIVSSLLPVETLPADLAVTRDKLMTDLAPLYFSVSIGCHSNGVGGGGLDCCDTDMVSDLCRGVAYCSALDSHHSLRRAFPFVGEMASTLQHRLAAVLDSLDADRKHLLDALMWDSSMTCGGWHSLALRVYVQATAAKPEQRSLPLQSLGALESLHHVIALVPLLSPDTQQGVVSAMVDKIQQQADKDSEAVLGILAHLVLHV